MGKQMQKMAETLAKFAIDNNIDMTKHTVDEVFRGWLSAQEHNRQWAAQEILEGHKNGTWPPAA